MRKKIYSLVFIALLGLLFSCGGDVEKQIVGEWTVEEVSVENLEEVVEAYKEYAGELTEEEVDEFKQELVENMTSQMNGSKIVFKEDKTIIIDEGEEGKWSLSEDKKIIKAVNDNVTLEFNIEKINDETLIFDFVIKKEADIKIKMKCKK